MLLRLWDEFFIKGQKVLFRVSLAMLYCMKDDLKKTRDFCNFFIFIIFFLLEDIFGIIESYQKNLEEAETLIQVANMKKFKVKNRNVNELRTLLRP